MQQIAALISGIVGAENGTAYFYQRGTSTPVDYYTDFEGTNLVATGTLALDAYGGGSAYVNQLTRVLVKNSVGTTIRDFVVGNNAKSEEVISAAFTGTDYTGAPTAVSKPTTAAAIFDAWLASAGATGTDWKVQYNGVGINLSSLAAKIGTPVFNVKAPEYGAIGDGVANDTAAINLAKVAAVAAGGGIVFFPPGTYRHTTTLTVQSGVHLQGSGLGVSILSIAANAVSLTFGAVTARQTVSDLTIVSSQARPNDILDTSASTAKVSFFRCAIGGSTDSNLYDDSSLIANLYFEECEFTTGTSSTRFLGTRTQTSKISFNRCRFTLPASYTGQFLMGPSLAFMDCYFDLSACAAGTIDAIIAIGTTAGAASQALSVIQGCEFSVAGGVTITSVINPVYQGVNAAGVFYEENNKFGSALVPFTVKSNGGTEQPVYGEFRSRRGRTVVIADDTAALDISSYTLAYETVIIRRSTNADQTVTVAGARIRQDTTYVVVHNVSGGTIASQIIGNGAAVSMLTATRRLWSHRVDYDLTNNQKHGGTLINGATMVSTAT